MRTGSSATGELTCIDRHKGIDHQLPDMIGVPVMANPIPEANAEESELAGET